MARLNDIHADAAHELGYRPVRVSGDRGHVTMDDMLLVSAVFPSVERHVLEGALVFPDAEPALRFYASNRIDGIENKTVDNRHRAELLPLVRRRIDTIVKRDGAFRLPKAVGWFVADN
jgi:hypothetical protein